MIYRRVILWGLIIAGFYFFDDVKQLVKDYRREHGFQIDTSNLLTLARLGKLEARCMAWHQDFHGELATNNCGKGLYKEVVPGAGGLSEDLYKVYLSNKAFDNVTADIYQNRYWIFTINKDLLYHVRTRENLIPRKFGIDGKTEWDL